jgi:microcystin-dependent protein
MPRNGSGTYSIPNTFSSGSTIASSAVNANNSDIGAEVTNSLARDGQSSMTGQFKAASGSEGSPGIGWSSDTDTGFRRSTGDTMKAVTGGDDLIEFGPDGIAMETGKTITDGSGNLVAGFPVGFIGDYAGTSAPPLWLLCYGQSLLRADYTALFAAIGTTYGAADGTHFSLPDCRGRVIAGQDDMGGSSANRLTGVTGSVDGDVLGGTGGEETHTLTEAELPTITPSGTVTKPTITVTNGTQVVRGATSASPGGGNNTGSTTSTITAALDSTPTFTGAPFGSGSAHNNVQPTIILNKIIFAGV